MRIKIQFFGLFGSGLSVASCELVVCFSGELSFCIISCNPGFVVAFSGVLLFLCHFPVHLSVFLCPVDLPLLESLGLILFCYA